MIKIRQKLDTRIQIARSQAFGTFDVKIVTEDGDVIVTLDMESTVFILENMDEGSVAYHKGQKFGWFGGLKSAFRKRG